MNVVIPEQEESIGALRTVFQLVKIPPRYRSETNMERDLLSSFLVDRYDENFACSSVAPSIHFFVMLRNDAHDHSQQDVITVKFVRFLAPSTHLYFWIP